VAAITIVRLVNIIITLAAVPEVIAQLSQRAIKRAAKRVAHQKHMEKNIDPDTVIFNSVYL
jgi:lipid A disaccharide synthetase